MLCYVTISLCCLSNHLWSSQPPFLQSCNKQPSCSLWGGQALLMRQPHEVPPLCTLCINKVSTTSNRWNSVERDKNFTMSRERLSMSVNTKPECDWLFMIKSQLTHPLMRRHTVYLSFNLLKLWVHYSHDVIGTSNFGCSDWMIQSCS